jgi:hypothetical protein
VERSTRCAATLVRRDIVVKENVYFSMEMLMEHARTMEAPSIYLRVKNVNLQTSSPDLRFILDFLILKSKAHSLSCACPGSFLENCINLENHTLCSCYSSMFTSNSRYNYSLIHLILPVLEELFFKLVQHAKKLILLRKIAHVLLDINEASCRMECNSFQFSS